MSNRAPSLHPRFARAAFALARHGSTLPYPNPWVGAVIVSKGRIVGRGFHRGPGTNHAEVEALKQAGSRARGAAIYVTLEPCCHYGRTPPCTDAILRAGVREVFYSLDDPNPEVRGKGARILRANGLKVHRGLMQAEARTLNEAYLKFRSTNLPFVTAKVAATLDGKIATRAGESKWITDAVARAHARTLRAQHQAVLVGIGTILADDPHLGPRGRNAAQPWRVVLDSRLRIPLSSKAVQSRKCIVACTAEATRKRAKALEARGVRVWRFPGRRRVPLKALLEQLCVEGIISVLVEGGGEVLGSFFDAHLVDRMVWFLEPMIVGSQRSRAAIGGNGVAHLADAWRIRNFHLDRAGNALRITGNLSRWAMDGGGRAGKTPTSRQI